MDLPNESATAFSAPEFQVNRLSDVRLAEQQAFNNLTASFWRIIAAGRPISTRMAQMLTTQEKKIAGAQHLANHRTHGSLEVTRALVPDFIETQTASARQAALEKARYGRDYTQKTQETHDPFFGGDVAHWARVKDGFKLIHKLARRKTPDTEAELAARLNNLKRHYGRLDGELNLDVYEVALAMANTVETVASTFIYVWSRPFDEAQVQEFIDRALETGHYRTSNSRGAFFETVASYGLLQAVAVIPEEYFMNEGRNADISRWQQAPTPALEAAITSSIHTTTPSVILGMRNPTRRRR